MAFASVTFGFAWISLRSRLVSLRFRFGLVWFRLAFAEPFRGSSMSPMWVQTFNYFFILFQGLGFWVSLGFRFGLIWFRLDFASVANIHIYVPTYT